MTILTADDEAVSDFPAGWRLVRLSELCERIDYGFTASADFSVSEPRFLRITDIQDGQVDWGTVPGCKISEHEVVANQLRDGDIVFARTGATTGKSFLIQEPPRAVFASYLIRLRVKSECDPEFLSLFFQGPDYWQQIRSQARGGAQPNFNASMLSALKVKLPRLAEQRRIAGRLREQLAEVAKARTAVQAQLAAAQALPAALFRAVFDSSDAKSWSRVPLKKLIVSKLRTGISKSTDNDSPNRCLTLSSVRNGELKTDESKPAAITDAELQKYGIRPGVFYVVRGNGNRSLVARAGQAPESFAPVAFPDLLIEVVPDPALLVSDYFRFAWAAPEVRRDVEDRVRTAAGIYKINLQNLSEVAVPVPELDDQRTIAARLAAEFAEVTQLRESLSGKLEALDRLPAALLAQAFQGE